MQGTEQVSAREARAEALLDTAIEVIRRVGSACSIDDIAAEVGVTRPIIYRYFGSREGLARAVSARAVAEVRDTLVTAMLKARSGKGALRGAIEGYLAFIESDPELYRYLVRGPLGREQHAEGARQSGFVDGLGRELGAVIRDQLAAAGRDTGPADAWAFALIGMMGAAGDWWLEEPTMSRKRLAEYLTQMAWAGMAGQTSGGSNG